MYFQSKTKKIAPAPPPPAEEEPLPAYIQTRSEIFTKLKIEQDKVTAKQIRDELLVTLPDGRIMEGFTWETTPFDIAQELSHSLASEVVVAKVNDELWDLERPFETNSSLHLLKFKEPEAQNVFWNSTAFVLGDAVERAYGAKSNALVAAAAATDDGLYCDLYLDKTSVGTTCVSLMTRNEHVSLSRTGDCQRFSNHRCQNCSCIVCKISVRTIGSVEKGFARIVRI